MQQMAVYNQFLDCQWTADKDKEENNTEKKMMKEKKTKKWQKMI